MSRDETVSDAEDLEVDGAEGESVVGGFFGPVSKFSGFQEAQVEIRNLAREGYVECACIENGTVMEHPKTGKRVTITF
jgi:hypothetical protein